MIPGRCLIAVAALLALVQGCGSTPPVSSPETPAAPVKDNSAFLPRTDRTGVTLVPNHLLGIPKLPGGTVGDYQAAGRKYQLFVIETASNQDAAFLLLDAKTGLQAPQLIPWMGGYFGTNDSHPIFVFPKLKYLAGVAGLPEAEADPIARVLASRLR